MKPTEPPDPRQADLFAAKAARDASMEQAEANADVLWRLAAFDAIVAVAREQPFLTTDHVVERMRPGGAQTHEWRALGPIMLRAAREGVIKKSGLPSVLCRRRSRHAAPITVWRSLLYEGGADAPSDQGRQGRRDRVPDGGE